MKETTFLTDEQCQLLEGDEERLGDGSNILRKYFKVNSIIKMFNQLLSKSEEREKNHNERNNIFKGQIRSFGRRDWGKTREMVKEVLEVEKNQDKNNTAIENIRRNTIKEIEDHPKKEYTHSINKMFNQLLSKSEERKKNHIERTDIFKGQTTSFGGRDWGKTRQMVKEVLEDEKNQNKNNTAI